MARRQGRSWILAMALALALAGSTAPASAQTGDVYARVGQNEVVIGNDLVERRWSRSPFRTTSLVDKRDGGRSWVTPGRDFGLSIGGAELGSDQFGVRQARVERLRGGGMRVVLVAAATSVTVTRTVEAYPSIAGFRTRTTVESPLPLVLTGATLDEAAADGTPTAHSFRAGADWREPDWPGPPLALGDPHPGTWRETRTGRPLEAPAQWLSLRNGGRSLFMVMERPDLPSSRAEYDAGVARLAIRYGRDGVLLGPFEEQAHAEGLSSAAGRPRVLKPGSPLTLEPVFTGLGAGDGDEEWQHHRFLTERRLEPYPHAAVFNSNGTDSNRISTGAKDDMDFATVREVAPLARRLGIETFVLDDGWQAVSGDWDPDPRRFPDAEFKAVREAIAPMRLGLWMSPMSFHPRARAYAEHPDWACMPLGHATALVNTLDPESGSNEAGIGLWSTAAIPHVESRIRRAIERWGVEYFKFDFLVWLDCAGAGDVYDYREAFVAMIDRLQRDHPRVTFQIDETNDYRMFPFESVARGPSWFQNGTPEPHRLLHNLWNLSPWVPSFSLGQHFLGGRAHEQHPVGTLMAAAMLSHPTFFSDLRELSPDVIDAAAPWLRFHREHRDDLAGVVYPLLADPLAKGWTAMQAWDPERGRGALLAFRQDGAESTRTIALRNVPPGRSFELVSAPDGAPAGTATSEELAAGIEVEIPERRGAAVLLIRPVS